MTKDWTGNSNSIYKTLGASNHTDIAPMFADAKKYKNIFLPKSFWEVIS